MSRDDGFCGQSASAAHARKMYDRVSALAKIGVWECDLATSELTWTDGVYDLFDIPRGTAVSREQSLACYDGASRRELEQLRSRAVETGTGFALDVAIRTKLGNQRWIRLTVDVEQEDGKSVRIFGTKQDITAERAAQDKLHALQTELIHVSRLSAMNTMRSTLAHEVNQPLAAISNYMAAASRIAGRAPVPDALLQCIEGAQHASIRAAEIVRQMRAIKADDPAEKSDLDFEELAKEAAALVVTGRPEIAVTYRLAPNTPVKADRLQIQQVLINLLQNAVEAGAGEPGEIEITTMRRQTELEIRVRDDGPGIPAGLLPNVFDAFVTTRSGKAGVGLAICRTIVEDHGGIIEVETLPRRGTSIRFTLPLSAA